MFLMNKFRVSIFAKVGRVDTVFASFHSIIPLTLTPETRKEEPLLLGLAHPKRKIDARVGGRDN